MPITRFGRLLNFFDLCLCRIHLRCYTCGTNRFLAAWRPYCPDCKKNGWLKKEEG
jgi:hypothetical protein